MSNSSKEILINKNATDYTVMSLEEIIKSICENPQKIDFAALYKLNKKTYCKLLLSMGNYYKQVGEEKAGRLAYSMIGYFEKSQRGAINLFLNKEFGLQTKLTIEELKTEDSLTEEDLKSIKKCIT